MTQAGDLRGAAARTNPPPSLAEAWFRAQPADFHRKWMALALAEARLAAEEGEVPMGCVIVRRCADGAARAVARAHNCVEALKDPTAHAEMLAITQAAAEVGDWRLTDCALYVTKEPCPMCGGAAVLGRLALVSWAADDPKRGASSVFGMFAHPGLNHRPGTLAPVGDPTILGELQDFFRARRGRQLQSAPQNGTLGRDATGLGPGSAATTPKETTTTWPNKSY